MLCMFVQNDFQNVICSHFLHLHSDALFSLSQLSRFYGSLQSRLFRHTPVSQLTQAPEKRRNCTILRTHNGLITARANATLINNSLGFFVPSSDGFHLPSLLLCYFFPLFVNFLLFLLSSLNFFFYIYIYVVFRCPSCLHRGFIKYPL